MTYLLSIDPGMSTGIVLGRFEDNTEYERLEFWQVEGGLPGLRAWLDIHFNETDSGWWKFRDIFPYVIESYEVTIVCEKFIPWPAPRSFKLNELEPIRIEGVIEDRFDPEVVWQPATAMVLAGGDTKPQRKRNSDDVLRRMGLWTTGKDVGMKDSNDVNSAQKHAIAYLKNIGHEPTKRFLAE